MTLLQQQYKRLRYLSARWPNPHEILSPCEGYLQPPTTVPRDLGRGSIQRPSTTTEATPLLEAEPNLPLDEDPLILDSEQLTLVDLLSAENEELEHDEAPAICDIKIKWILPVCFSPP